MFKCMNRIKKRLKLLGVQVNSRLKLCVAQKSTIGKNYCKQKERVETNDDWLCYCKLGGGGRL